MPIFPASLHCQRFESREHAESAYDGRKENIEGGKSSRGLFNHLQNWRLQIALLFRYSGQNFLCRQDTFFLPHVSFAPVRVARDGLHVNFAKFQVHLLLFLRWYGLWECSYKLVQIDYRLYSPTESHPLRLSAQTRILNNHHDCLEYFAPF